VGEREKPIEAEQSVIGAVLVDADVLPLIRQHVRLDDFTDGRHRVIWQAILDQVEAFEPVDDVTIVSRLKRTGKVEAAGGALYLAEVVEATPTVANVEYYAQIIRQAAGVRQIYKAARDAMREIESGADTRQVFDALARVRTEIESREPVSFGDLVDDFEAIITELKDREDRGVAVSPESFITTGYQALDTKLIGYGKGQLVILSGQSGGGKTALSLNCAARQVLAGYRIGFFSGEMSRQALARRVLSAAGKVNHHVLRKGLLVADDWTRTAQAKASFQRARFAINDTITSTEDVVAMAMRAHLVQPFDAIYVDYLQRLVPRLGPRDNREQTVAQAAVDMKNLARKLGVPVVVLSQLNSGGELRESKAIFHEADVVLEVTIPPKDSDSPHDGAVKINKQRDGESGIAVPLYWQGQYVRFDDLSEPTKPTTSKPTSTWHDNFNL
jgi:replicative DNA helicase